MKRFLKEFRVELIAVLVVLFGFFLLIEQFDIRVTIFRFASQLIGQIKSVAETIYKVVINYQQLFETQMFLDCFYVFISPRASLKRLRLKHLRCRLLPGRSWYMGAWAWPNLIRGSAMYITSYSRYCVIFSKLL